MVKIKCRRVFGSLRSSVDKSDIDSVLGNFMHTWNYHDNHDNKQHYHDRRISIIAQP